MKGAVKTRSAAESMQKVVESPCSVKIVEQTEKETGEQSHPQAGLQLPESKSWSTGKQSCELLVSVSSNKGAA